MRTLAVVHVAPVVAAIVALATPARSEKPVCAKWWTQVVATAWGYNHVVYVENQCDQKMSCTISIDVAPQPITAAVAGKERAEVVTFRGSPSREFHAKVECTSN